MVSLNRMLLSPTLLVGLYCICRWVSFLRVLSNSLSFYFCFCYSYLTEDDFFIFKEPVFSPYTLDLYMKVRQEVFPIELNVRGIVSTNVDTFL